MGKDSEMNKWESLSFADQMLCVFKVFNALVDGGVLSNKGRRNYVVIKSKLESMFGCTIAINPVSWEAFVNKSIPKATESAEDRNARKNAEAAEISIDLGL